MPSINDVLRWRPEEITSIATQLEGFATNLESSISELNTVQSTEWQGVASNAAETDAFVLADKMRSQAQDLKDVASALRTGSARIHDAQQQLKTAKEQIDTIGQAMPGFALSDSGELQTAPAPKESDYSGENGTVVFDGVKRLYEELNQVATASAAKAQDALEQALAADSWLANEVHRIGGDYSVVDFLKDAAKKNVEAVKSLGLGVGDAVVDTWHLVTNPGEAITAIPELLKLAKDDPRKFLATLVDADKFQKDPLRWLGMMAGGLLLAKGVGKIGGIAARAAATSEAGVAAIENLQALRAKFPLLKPAEPLPLKSTQLRVPEETLQNGVVQEVAAPPISGMNPSSVLTFENGIRGIYKPDAADAFWVREDSSFANGTASSREVGAYVVDKHLGFDLVPTTVAYEGPQGMGSLQLMVDHPQEGNPVATYTKIDQQKMGVLDYVVGNTDRHSLNYLTSFENRPVAIDHGLSFPEDSVSYLRSTWTTDILGKPLDETVLSQIRSVDNTALHAELMKNGLPQAAADNAINRLAELQQYGHVNGSTWTNDAHVLAVKGRPGYIADEYMRFAEPIEAKTGLDHTQGPEMPRNLSPAEPLPDMAETIQGAP